MLVGAVFMILCVGLGAMVLEGAAVAWVVGMAEVGIDAPGGVADGQQEDGCNDDVLIHG